MDDEELGRDRLVAHRIVGERPESMSEIGLLVDAHGLATADNDASFGSELLQGLDLVIAHVEQDGVVQLCAESWRDRAIGQINLSVGGHRCSPRKPLPWKPMPST